MRGDVTRQTFRSGKHYRSVLQQQGRVQLDADWNEQADIQAYLDRTVTADLVGVSGAPSANPGMAITKKDGTPLETPVTATRLWISKGHYYVDGILCENDEAVQVVDQPDLPGVTLDDKIDGTYIAYIDVWFEHLTVLDRPALREVALGGPDTTTRARTIWQVRLRPDGEDPPAGADERKAQMRAQAVAPDPDEPTPCVVGPAAAYRRLENQLYRVEVLDPSIRPDGTPGTPTFLWSRENGSVVAALTPITPPAGPTSVLTLAAPGRDARLAFEKDYWVEVTDLARTRRGEPGLLAKIEVAAGPALTVAWPFAGADPTPEELEELTVGLAGLENPVARRWDGEAGPQPLFPDPADPNGIALEDGVHVEFATDGTYVTGDYWLIPARTANLEGEPVVADLAGNIEWPRDDKGDGLPQPPVGVVHHYADIARLTRAVDLWAVTRDDRPVFDPIAGRLDVTVAGGDGQESLPGVALDQPLRVAVTRDLSPVPGATVRFTTADDGALLVPPDPNTGGAGVQHQAEVPTDDEGIASCGWQLDPAGRPSQQVTARLLDANRRPTGPALMFTGSLSLAGRVAFDDRDCAAMTGATTVQKAVGRLASTPVLVANGGNGQIAVPDATLAASVDVLVRSCGQPVPGATVRFTITQGGGAPGRNPSAPSVDIATDGSGVAQCQWQLGRELPLQTLTATLLDAGAPDLRAVPLTFLAGVVPEVLTAVRTELPSGTALVDGAFVAVTDLAGERPSCSTASRPLPRWRTVRRSR